MNILTPVIAFNWGGGKLNALFRKKVRLFVVANSKIWPAILAAPQERLPFGPAQSLAKDENKRVGELTA